MAQLTSRRKLYDSKGREKLEAKADMRGRGLESPDRADAIIGAVMLGNPGLGGGITARELGRIKFGSPPGGRLFDSAAVRFDEELTSGGPSVDLREVERYPFGRRWDR